MPVYRGGWGHREAKKRFIRELPVSVKNDDSVLWGEQSVNSHTLKLTNKTAGEGEIHNDYLVYGWKPFFAPAALGVFYGFVFVFIYVLDVYILRIGDKATFGGLTGALWGGGISLVSALYLFASPFDRYVVFDRRNQLVHLPRWFSRKQDSVRWEEADFGIIDVRHGQFDSRKGTNLYVVKPPWSLLHDGYFNWRTGICIHQESKFWRDMTRDGHSVEGAESVFRFIIDFMTQPPERSVSLNYVVGMDLIMDEAGCPMYYPLTYRYFLMLLNPEYLPMQPNWLREADGHWQQIAPAVTVRAGWFGLWGKGLFGKHLTLLPHLRGTRSDPAFHDDPDAPLPGARWVAVEDGGTGELVGQPPEVIRAVLQGQGMPSKEQLDATRLKEGGWPGTFSEREKWYEAQD